MYGVSSILTLENVALISFMKLPHDLGLLNDIFAGVSKEGVSIDMVSQTSPLSGNISVSFSFPEDDMVKVLTVVNTLKEKHPDMKPVVSSGNTKLTLSGEEMRVTPGVFARSISSLAKISAELLAVTTSETEVSLLIPSAHADDAKEALEKGFSL